MTLLEHQSHLQIRSISSTSHAQQISRHSIERDELFAGTDRDWICHGSQPRGGSLGLLEAIMGIFIRQTLWLNNAEHSSWS